MQSKESPNDPRIDAITSELRDVARRRVPGAFGELGKQDALPIPELRIITERNFPQVWRENPPNALTLLLKRAISLLDGKFGDPPRTQKDERITMQEAALRLFNLDGSPTFPEVKPLDVDDVKFKDIRGPKYNIILSELVKNANIHKSQSEITRDIADLRLRLAKIIAGPTFSHTSIDTEPTTPISCVLVVRSVLEDEFVARPEYEQAIKQLRDAGEKHLWLWGDAGTGKTRLARAATRDRVAEHAVPVLAGNNEQMLQDQIVDLIVRSGIDAEVVNSANRWALFLDQLNKGRLPQTLVFDDMPRGGLLTMLMATHGSFIIFTSIGRPPPEYNGPCIEVIDMTVDESQKMVRSRLSGIQDSDLNLLTTTLAGRPLAIEHSCCYLRETGVPVADYCRAIARQPARTLEAAGNQHGRTLTAVYEMILERLTDSFDSVRALDYILFTQPGLITADMLSYMWVDDLGIPSLEAATALFGSPTASVVSFFDAHRWPGVIYPKLLQIPYVDPAETVILRAALRKLVDFGLIRSEDERIVMHQLTRFILGALRQNRSAHVFECVKKTVYDLLIIDEWRPGEPVQGHLLMWAPHVARAVAQIDATAPDTQATLDLDETKKLALLGAMVLRVYLQLGLSIAAAVQSVKHLYGAVAGWFLEAGEDRQHLKNNFFGLYQEMTTVITLGAGFSRKLDGALLLDESAPELGRFANGIRLEYDTEWELSRNFVNIESFERNVRNEKVASTLLGMDGSALKDSARAAMLISRIYYDQCQWNDAIAALEHAYSCYIKIGGDTAAIRGAIDAARRLSRVYLRAGPCIAPLASTPTSYLDTATQWLMRAQWIKYRRSDAILNGQPSRYRLRDALLDAQLDQALTQIELTRHFLE